MLGPNLALETWRRRGEMLVLSWWQKPGNTGSVIIHRISSRHLCQLDGKWEGQTREWCKSPAKGECPMATYTPFTWAVDRRYRSHPAVSPMSVKAIQTVPRYGSLLRWGRAPSYLQSILDGPGKTQTMVTCNHHWILSHAKSLMLLNADILYTKVCLCMQ